MPCAGRFARPCARSVSLCSSWELHLRVSAADLSTSAWSPPHLASVLSVSLSVLESFSSVARHVLGLAELPASRRRPDPSSCSLQGGLPVRGTGLGQPHTSWDCVSPPPSPTPLQGSSSCVGLVESAFRPTSRRDPAAAAGLASARGAGGGGTFRFSRHAFVFKQKYHALQYACTTK